MKIIGYVEQCRESDPSLPADWEIYSFKSLPNTGVPTHTRLVGSVPRLLKTGKNKGRKTWRDKTYEREFIFAI